MNYQTFITTKFVPDINSLFTSLRTFLLSNGFTANNVTIDTPDAVNYQMRITAKRGNKTFVIIAEVTPSGTVGGQMGVQITLTATLNGSPITNNYIANAAISYASEAGIDVLINKLLDMATTVNGELRTALITL